MTLPYYNTSYGLGIEGVLNYTNAITDWYMVPFYLLFVFIALIIVFSNNKKFPMSSIVSYSFLVVMLIAFLFKLATSVGENYIYIIIAGLGIAVGWGLWQSK